MTERLLNKIRLERSPLKLHGDAAILMSGLLQREVTVHLGREDFLRGTVERYNSPDNLTVTLINCRLYRLGSYGLPGYGVFDSGTRKVGVDRIELEICRF